MKYEAAINEVQAQIMRQLFKRDVLRFSEINTEGLPSDQFSYHLRQLTKNGLIEKLSDNRYRLSIMGKSRAILLDTRSSKYIDQGFVACRVILGREVNGKKEYLIQKRTRVPYYGYIADPGGKILYGEDVAAAAKRNMLAETGLTCEMTVQGIAHFKDDFKDSIVQDKFFFVIKATKPSGTLLQNGPTGENLWMSLEEIQTSEKVHKGFVELIQIAEGEGFGFIEATHVVSEY